MPTHASPPHRRRQQHSNASPSRSRSRSPTRSSKHHRHRERDGHDRHHRHGPSSHRHDRDRDRERPSNPPTNDHPITLPFQARELTKRDLRTFEPMFAMYLDIQKGLIMEDLSEEEVKGRWKSFIGKWNRGELAEGWYDPATFQKAREGANALAAAPRVERGYGRDTAHSAGNEGEDQDQDEDDEDDEYGPMPQVDLSGRAGGGPALGPTIPTMQDLELRKETSLEDRLAERDDLRQHHRAEIRSHKSELRHMEEEVAPRAEPGTHERRMEKRREAAASNRAFAETRRGGSPTEAVPEDELLGSGENDLAAIKSAREREQRRKNEREIRREEILRARAAEREERVRQYREKEEETIGWLKTLAKQRFG